MFLNYCAAQRNDLDIIEKHQLFLLDKLLIQRNFNFNGLVDQGAQSNLQKLSNNDFLNQLQFFCKLLMSQPVIIQCVLLYNINHCKKINPVDFIGCINLNHHLIECFFRILEITVDTTENMKFLARSLCIMKYTYDTMTDSNVLHMPDIKRIYELFVKFLSLKIFLFLAYDIQDTIGQTTINAKQDKKILNLDELLAEISQQLMDTNQYHSTIYFFQSELQTIKNIISQHFLMSEIKHPEDQYIQTENSLILLLVCSPNDNCAIMLNDNLIFKSYIDQLYPSVTPQIRNQYIQDCSQFRRENLDILYGEIVNNIKKSLPSIMCNKKQLVTMKCENIQFDQGIKDHIKNHIDKIYTKQESKQSENQINQKNKVSKDSIQKIARVMQLIVTLKTRKAQRCMANLANKTRKLDHINLQLKAKLTQNEILNDSIRKLESKSNKVSPLIENINLQNRQLKLCYKTNKQFVIKQQKTDKLTFFIWLVFIVTSISVMVSY